ncbi:hypothetical protein FRC08_001073 [Ceratobasidium sp. 394]|nr:hypothetical protein FRC08_001073 [Ceratobasidium sp. 394]KAG9099663.1 hypothetical protein FS749_000725 [Ceratobasidium sp. UAMH 11750]
MLAEAIGKSRSSQIVHVQPPANVSQERFAAYAIYEHKKLARVALINFSQFNKSTAANPTPGVRVRIRGSANNMRLKRMAAPGLDERNADFVTWAGQAYTNGTASGKFDVERVSNGVVWVRDSEAVLVFLS